MRPAQRSLALLLVLCLASCLPVDKGQSPDLTGQRVRLTVLHTSDIHSRMLPYELAPLKTDADLGLAPEAPPYGGVSRLAAMIRREKARADRTLLVDSGDYWDGGPIFNMANGEPEVRWMSLMGYDGVVMGNHEFDKGAPNFADKMSRFGSYPLLVANYWWEGRDLPNAHGLDKLSVPYSITNVRGVKVGILGMASIGSMYGLVDGGNSVQATPLEQNETVRAYLKVLQPMVDVVLVLSHLGLTEDQDLITGYDAYYPYEHALPFMSRAKDDPTRWVQVEPLPSDCEKAGTAPEKCTFLDGTVRVFIPGVTGIDAIMGGHLHVVLNPPQVIRDPSDRPVIISHPGAFSKYLGRLEIELGFPAADADEARKAQGAEILAHDYRAFPVDAIWCDDEARSWRSKVQNEEFREMIVKRPATTADGTSCRDAFWQALPDAIADDCIAKYDRDFRSFDCDRFLPTECQARAERCSNQEDRVSTDLLQPYIMQLDSSFALPRIFAFAPRTIARRNSSTGGDAPLGNMTAESMRIRKRVEAEFSLTNTLGMRDNLYAGPITLESMFNVFPFENTINIMYLSGDEVQELADYVAQRSAERGCQAQAQISGMSFTMDCAQDQVNIKRLSCETSADCNKHGAVQHPDGWRCTEEKVCWAHEAYDVRINGEPINTGASYKIAVNDYIARGGSGFKILKRNTTRVETGISLRDSLIDYLRGQCTCEEILGLDPRNQGKPDDQKASIAGYACARNREAGQWIIDPIVLSWCKQAKTFADLYGKWLADKSFRLPDMNADMCHCDKVLAGDENACGGPVTEELKAYCGLSVGKCTCAQVVSGDEKNCGHITRELKNFCSMPIRVPIAIGEEDGRIGRRVK